MPLNIFIINYILSNYKINEILDKLARLEAEVAGKVDELSSQRRALETSWYVLYFNC